MLIALISGLFGSIIGGLITGMYSLRAVSKTEEADHAKRIAAEAKVLKSVLQALHDELETIFSLYTERIGTRVETLPEGQPLPFYFPVIQDFFTVYNANAALIGRIENNDLRKSVIQTYVMMKGLVDSFRMNNDLLSRFEYWHRLAIETNNPIHIHNAKEQHTTLVAYAAQIKKGHFAAKKSLDELMRMLHKQGVLHEA